MILLDTNILIDIDIVDLPEAAVAVSTISAAELQFGIARAFTNEQRRLRRARFQRIIMLLQTPWLPFDDAAAAGYGRLAAIVANTRPSHARSKDIMLAGHAYSLGAAIMTRNPKNFELLADEVEIIVPELR